MFCSFRPKQLNTSSIQTSAPRVKLTAVTLTLLSLTFAQSAISESNDDSISIASEIKAVTVFPDSAKITRLATANLVQGSNEITLSHLPLQLNPATLRVKVADNDEIKIDNIDLEQQHQSALSQPAQQSLRDQIESIETQIAERKQNISRFNQQIKLINSMADNKSDSASSYQQLPMAQWTEAWALIDENVEKYQRKIQQEQQQTVALSKQIEVLRKELDDLGNTQSSYYNLGFSAYSKTSGPVALEVEYQIQNAYWSPEYDLALDPKSGDVTAITLANIRQQTGEDWNDVQMTVSTRRPNADISLPNLQPWTLQFFEPRMYRKSESKALTKSSALMDSGSAADEMIVAELTESSAGYAPMASQLVSSDYTAEYKLSEPVTLKSSGNQKKLTISEQTLASEITINSTPRFDDRALIIANIEYQGEAPLLPGQANLYLNNQFIGNQRLPMVQSGDELKLSFGEDDLVQIRFRPDPDQKSENGIFSKNKSVERHYLVTIKNQHDSPKKIVISEQFPIAEDERIVVKRSGVKPDREDVDDRKGIVAWDIESAAQSDTALRYGYTVTYPADMQVGGLE